MDYFEKTVSSKKIYSGKVINMRVDTVELPNGNLAERELVEHPGGVGIVAVDGNGNVLLVEQFRKPYEKNIIEIPAGKLEKGEDVSECGMRELEEETGYVANKFEFLGECYPSVGYTDEVIRLFLATELVKKEQNLDDDEFLSVIRIPVREMLQKIMDNEVKDAKTAIGILKACVKLGILN